MDSSESVEASNDAITNDPSLHQSAELNNQNMQQVVPDQPVQGSTDEPDLSRVPRRKGFGGSLISGAKQRWAKVKTAFLGMKRALNMAKADKDEFLTSSNQIHRLANEGKIDIALEVHDKKELKKINYLKQGNEEFYSHDALQKRHAIRHDPLFMDAVKSLWSWLPRVGNPPHLGISKSTYCAHVKLVQNILLPMYGLEPDMNYDPSEDWDSDCKGEPLLNFPNFLDAMFELVDMWCEDISAKDYANMLKSITGKCRKNERTFANLLKRYEPPPEPPPRPPPRAPEPPPKPPPRAPSPPTAPSPPSAPSPIPPPKAVAPMPLVVVKDPPQKVILPPQSVHKPKLIPHYAPRQERSPSPPPPPPPPPPKVGHRVFKPLPKYSVTPHKKDPPEHKVLFPYAQKTRSRLQRPVTATLATGACMTSNEVPDRSIAPRNVLHRESSNGMLAESSLKFCGKDAKPSGSAGDAYSAYLERKVKSARPAERKLPNRERAERKLASARPRLTRVDINPDLPEEIPTDLELHLISHIGGINGRTPQEAASLVEFAAALRASVAAGDLRGLTASAAWQLPGSRRPYTAPNRTRPTLPDTRAATAPEQSRSDRVPTEELAAAPSTIPLYCRDLTEAALREGLKPLLPSAPALERSLKLLSGPKHINPMLLCDPGDGKAAVLESLAQQLAASEVPQSLKGARLLELNMTMLRSGVKDASTLEARMEVLLMELAAEPERNVLFVDNFPVSAATSSQAGDTPKTSAFAMLPLLLAYSAELRMVGAMSPAAWPRVERDAVLQQHFEPVMVNVPGTEATLAYLTHLRPRYEQEQSVRIADSALQAAAQLAHEYLPDRAADLLAEAAEQYKDKAEALANRGFDRSDLLVSRRYRATAAQHDAVPSLPEVLEEPGQVSSMVTSSLDMSEPVSPSLAHSISRKASHRFSSFVTIPLIVTDSDVCAVVSEWTGLYIDLVKYKNEELLLKALQQQNQQQQSKLNENAIVEGEDSSRPPTASSSFPDWYFWETSSPVRNANSPIRPSSPTDSILSGSWTYFTQRPKTAISSVSSINTITRPPSASIVRRGEPGLSRSLRPRASTFTFPITVNTNMHDLNSFEDKSNKKLHVHVPITVVQPQKNTIDKAFKQGFNNMDQNGYQQAGIAVPRTVSSSFAFMDCEEVNQTGWKDGRFDAFFTNSSNGDLYSTPFIEYVMHKRGLEVKV